MTIEEPPALPGGEIIVYESPDGEGRVDVRFEHDSVWLTQRQMAEAQPVNGLYRAGSDHRKDGQAAGW